MGLSERGGGWGVKEMGRERGKVRDQLISARVQSAGGGVLEGVVLADGWGGAGGFVECSLGV